MTSVEVGTGKRKSVPISSQEAPPAKRPATRASGGEATMDVDEAAAEIVEETIKIKAAKPSPSDIPGWGQIGDLVNSYGIFVPFMSDLCSFDKRTVVQVLIRYFLQCLGNTTEEMFSGVERIRTEMGVISNTDTGNKLAHMAATIDMAINAQAKAFPVFDGVEYIGTALLGAEFSLSVNGQTYTPHPFETLVKIVENFGVSQSILIAIGKVGCVEDEDGFEWSTGNCPGIVGMEHLSNIVRSWSVSESDRDEIVKLASKLSLPTKHWAINSTTISDGLRYITESDADFPDASPIHFSMLFNGNKVDRIWSCFGGIAPTPMFDGGRKISLTDVNTPTTITFRQVPLTTAITDIKRLISEKKIAQPVNSRSGPYKNRVFKGIDAKKIFGSLMTLAGVTVSDGTTYDVQEGGAVSAGLFEDF